VRRRPWLPVLPVVPSPPWRLVPAQLSERRPLEWQRVP
jgi:hypothetical protein